MSKKITNLKQISSQYSHFFFDLDGVVWKGQQPVKGGFEALHYLRSINKKLYFVTNSSIRNRQMLKERFTTFGFQTQLNEFYPASYCTALYLQSQYPHVKKALVVGEPSLEQDIKTTGIEVVYLDDVAPPEHESIGQIIKKIDHSIDCVIMGYDFRLTYNKICFIAAHVQREGVAFIATNPDRYTIIDGIKVPGNGSILACIELTSEKQADIAAKPNPFLFDLIVTKQKINKKECLMIGDNINTDIKFAINGGIDSLCVLTGVAQEKDILENNLPTYFTEYLL